MIYVNPRINNFEEIYQNQKSLVNYFLKREIADRTAFKLPLKLIEKYKPQGVALDIGCGIGNFLLLLKERGFKCFGVELNRECIIYGKEKRGLNILEGPLEKIDLPEKSFDLITILSTLEHMGHPLNTLTKARSLLKDDGIILISVPNIQYLFFRIQNTLGIKTKVLDPTAHLFYFTPATLRMLCEKTGLRVIYEEYALVSSVRVKNLIKEIIKRLIFLFSNHLQWGSTITMVLKTKESEI